MLNYQKLDPSLIQAWEEIKDSEKKAFDVFIRFEKKLANEELEQLKVKGINVNDTEKKIITAEVSKNEIDELSNQPWIKQIKLSRKLKLLD